MADQVAASDPVTDILTGAQLSPAQIKGLQSLYDTAKDQGDLFERLKSLDLPWQVKSQLWQQKKSDATAAARTVNVGGRDVPAPREPLRLAPRGDVQAQAAMTAMGYRPGVITEDAEPGLLQRIVAAGERLAQPRTGWDMARLISMTQPFSVPAATAAIPKAAQGAVTMGTAADKIAGSTLARGGGLAGAITVGALKQDPMAAAEAFAAPFVVQGAGRMLAGAGQKVLDLEAASNARAAAAEQVRQLAQAATKAATAQRVANVGGNTAAAMAQRALETYEASSAAARLGLSADVWHVRELIALDKNLSPEQAIGTVAQGAPEYYGILRQAFLRSVKQIGVPRPEQFSRVASQAAPAATQAAPAAAQAATQAVAPAGTSLSQAIASAQQQIAPAVQAAKATPQGQALSQNIAQLAVDLKTPAMQSVFQQVPKMNAVEAGRALELLKTGETPGRVAKALLEGRRP